MEFPGGFPLERDVRVLVILSREKEVERHTLVTSSQVRKASGKLHRKFHMYLLELWGHGGL